MLRVYDDQDIDVANVRSNLAIILLERGTAADAVEARQLLADVVIVYEQLESSRPTHLPQALMNLATAEAELGEFDRARELAERAMARFDSMGASPPDIGTGRAIEGAIAFLDERYQDAVAHADRSLEAYAQVEASSLREIHLVRDLAHARSTGSPGALTAADLDLIRTESRLSVRTRAQMHLEAARVLAAIDREAARGHAERAVLGFRRLGEHAQDRLAAAERLAAAP
jgi:tetratricopeptide (TPR) repeat protein